MNFRTVSDFREKRNHFLNMPHGQMHYSIASYCTDSSKDEMKATFGESFLTNLPMIPDPLRKNLADTLITAEAPKKIKTKSSLEETSMGGKISVDPPRGHQNNDNNETYSFSSITNFISSVLHGISGVMFQKRPKSPEDQHYDVFNYASDRKRSPDTDWQPPKTEDQNINERAHKQNGEKEINKTMEMSNDYRSTVACCEDKLNQVRNLLNKRPVQNVSRYRPRRPKKQFVDVGAYEEVYEDAFTTEDFISNLADDPFVEYLCPTTYQCYDFLEIDTPNIRIQTAPKDIPLADPKIDKNEVIEEEICDKIVENQNSMSELISETKDSVITSCEDKLSKLKALIQKKKSKCISKEFYTTDDSLPVPESNNIKNVKRQCKVNDKHFKNPHRTTNKREKNCQLRYIQEDIQFANEIDTESLSTPENSPPVKSETKILSKSPINDETDYFDEVSGRFRSTSTTESDDSFQIVFHETPSRARKVSECDSEDSFIVFEDSPESCYVSTDVFGDNPSDESDYSDTDSDLSDSGCSRPNLKCKLSPYMSRTISDLTDDSLYEDSPQDEVDCAFRTPVELSCQVLEAKYSKEATPEKKQQKKVHFSTIPPKVHVMRVWAFAAKQARVGHWERHARDRERFKRRIADVEMAVSWVLRPQHRSRVMFQRFKPWWNAEIRRELAQKKEEEKRRLEEEAKKDLEGNVDVEVEITEVEEQNDNDGDVTANMTINDDDVACIKDDEDKILKSNDEKRGVIKNLDGNDLENKLIIDETPTENVNDDGSGGIQVKTDELMHTENGNKILNSNNDTTAAGISKLESICKEIVVEEKFINNGLVALFNDGDNNKDIALDNVETVGFCSDLSEGHEIKEICEKFSDLRLSDGLKSAAT